MEDKIKELEAKIADLKNRFPAHSLKPHMFAELEDLEDELEELKKKQKQQTHKFNPQKMAKLDNPERRKLLPPDETVANIGVQAGDKVADIGCGIGYFTIPLAKKVGSEGQVFALDISSLMLTEAAKRFEAIKTPEMASVQFELSEENRFPLADAAVDTAFMALVLHETNEKITFLQEVKRIIKSTGKLVVLEWAKEAEVGPPVEHRVGAQETKTLMEQVGLHDLKEMAIGQAHYLVIGHK